MDFRYSRAKSRNFISSCENIFSSWYLKLHGSYLITLSVQNVQNSQAPFAGRICSRLLKCLGPFWDVMHSWVNSCFIADTPCLLPFTLFQIVVITIGNTDRKIWRRFQADIRHQGPGRWNSFIAIRFDCIFFNISEFYFNVDLFRLKFFKETVLINLENLNGNDKFGLFKLNQMMEVVV